MRCYYPPDNQVTCINSWRAVLWRWRADAWLTGLALDRACHGFVCSLEAPHSGAWRAPALPPLVCVVLHLARRFAKMLACTPSPISKLVAEDKVQMDVLDTRTTPSTKSFTRRSSSTSRSSATSPVCSPASSQLFSSDETCQSELIDLYESKATMMRISRSTSSVLWTRCRYFLNLSDCSIE